MVALLDEEPALVVRCPSNTNCRQYLTTSGFLQLIGKRAAVEGVHEFALAGPSSTADTVLPLTRLEEETALLGLRDNVRVKLEMMLGARGGGSIRELAPILSTIQEACANVFQHAGSGVAWIAAQRYKNRYTGHRYVEVGIADAGCGIRESLATRLEEFRRASDSEAVSRMLAEGLSRFADPYGGNGYQVLQEATRIRDGSFYLRSGHGAVSRRRHSAPQREDFVTRWPGTQLMVRFTCR